MRIGVRHIAIIIVFAMIASSLSGYSNPQETGADAETESVETSTPSTDAVPGTNPNDKNLPMGGIGSPAETYSLGEQDTLNGVPGLGNWSFREAHGIDQAEALGYDGQGIVMGIADTGVDFCKNELQDALMTVGNLTVQNRTLAIHTKDGMNQTALDIQGDMIWMKIYCDGAELAAGFSYDQGSGTITFDPPLDGGIALNCTYCYTPNNYGWPLVNDIGSLREYLTRNSIGEDSWFANTSATGNATGTDMPTFEYFHSPGFVMNGRETDFNAADREFQDTNTVATDGEFWDGESWQPISLVGGEDFDLTGLHVTRDHNYWYLGFNTKNAQVNRTYGIYLDFDNSTGGANIGPTGIQDPRGYYVDTESSHTTSPNSIAYHGNVGGQGLIASCANGISKGPDQGRVFIWNADGLLRYLDNPQGSTEVMRSIDWLPDGSGLVAASRGNVYQWNSADWSLVGQTSLGTNSQTHISVSQNSSLAAVSTGSSRIVIINLTNANSMAYSNNISTNVNYVAEFSPDGSRLAVGFGDGSIRVFDSTDLFQPSPAPSLIIYDFGDPGKRHIAPVKKLAWSPDGTRLASGGDDGRLFIWDSVTGQVLEAWNGTAGFHALAAPAQTGAMGGLAWDSTGIYAGTANGTLLVIDGSAFALDNIIYNRYQSPVTALESRGSGNVITGSMDCSMRIVDTGASTAVMQYSPVLLHMPDIVLYTDYTAEKYIVDENGDKIIGEADSISDPEMYCWEDGDWNTSNLGDHGEDLYYYKGNKELSSESQGLTETTLMGFVEFALPRSVTDVYGSRQLSVKLFVAGEEPSVAQDSVPSDSNIGFAGTNFTTTQIRTLSNFGYVEFPETTIQLSGIESQSGVYHYGLHPSDSLSYVVRNAPGSSGNDYVGILVVDANEAGVYDTVIVDLNIPDDVQKTSPLPNYIFDDQDLVATRDSPFLALDMMDISKNRSNPDGIYDYSAGLVYYVSDGDPLPYSSKLVELEGMSFTEDHPMPVPGPGDVVCMFGEFDTYIDTSGGGEIERVEKTGTIAASAMAGRPVVEDPAGYGIMAGAATGAKLVAVGRAGDYLESSLHFLVEGYDGIPGTGDEASIVYIGESGPSYMGGLDLDSHIIDSMAMDYLGGEVTFVLPAGDDGPGFGTIGAPCPHNALVVGSTIDNAYDAYSRPLHAYGEVAQWSSRGPSASGYAKPDIVAAGSGRFSEPLTSYGTPGGGNQNVVTYVGTRISAAIAAGSAAQAQQAYLDTWGKLPGMEGTIGLIKSSAEDMGYDMLAQGSGFLNSIGAVQMASGNGGILSQTIDLIPSNYLDSELSGFPGIMEAGTSASDKIELSNPGTTADIEATAETHELVWNMTINCGITDQVLLNISEMLPLNITLLRVSAICDAEDFFDATTMNPDIIVETAALIADWDQSSPFPGENDMTILCRGNEIEATGNVPTNVIELELGQPYQKFETNLWLALETGASSANWSIVLRGYTTEEWGWVDMGNVPDHLDAGESFEVAVEISVPQDTMPGSYSGAARIMSGEVQVSDESILSPPGTPVIDIEYEEAGITVGSQNGSLANQGLLDGSLELVRNTLQAGAWVSYRNSAADNNAIITMAGSEPVPYTIQIPHEPSVPYGTPISDVLVSWADDTFFDSLYDSGYWSNLDPGAPWIDYEVEPFAGGNITFIGSNWGWMGVGWAGCEFYINYTYEISQSETLSAPTDYTADLESGTLHFTSPVDASVVNITANYSFATSTFQRLCIPHFRLTQDPVLTRFNILTGTTDTIPDSEYDWSSLTGAIMMKLPQTGIYIVNASYTYMAHHTLTPILVNVGAARVPDYELGGAEDFRLNSPTQVYGGYSYGTSDHAGDRRYFYFNVPEDGLYRSQDNYRSYFTISWDQVPTDLDISIYGRDIDIQTMSGDVAPYVFREIGKGPSSPTTKPGNFTTSSGGANETLAVPLVPGINIICIRAKLLSGLEESYGFDARGGWVSFTSKEDREISTNQLGGSMPITVQSNIDLDEGAFATVLGPAVGKTYTNEEVYPDEIYYDVTQEDWWRINADSKYLRLVDVVEGTLSLDVRIIGQEDCPDLDLCLFYDGKNGQEDGISQWDEYIDKSLCEEIDNYGWGGVGTAFNTYAYSAGAGSDEATKVLKPQPGTWIIKVVGYEVSGSPGHFDLEIKMIKEGVKGYELTSSLEDNDAVENQVTHYSTVSGFTMITYNLVWEFPASSTEDGSFSGILSIGTPYSREVIALPLDVRLDRELPLLGTLRQTRAHSFPIPNAWYSAPFRTRPWESWTPKA